MRILLAHPGKLNTVPMGGFVKSALSKLGHDVVDFDLSSSVLDKFKDRAGLSKGEFHGSLNHRFRRVVEDSKPDFVIAIFGFDFSVETLLFLKSKGIKSACWWLNDPFQFQRSLQKATHYDYLFTNSKSSALEYREYGVKSAHWLPTACDPDFHKKTLPVEKYKAEVSFAGDWSPLREEWCLELARHFDLKIFGPWRKKISKGSPLTANLHDGFFTPTQMAEIFSSSRIVFNVHGWYGKWEHGTNPRLFEAAGCGSCQVVDYKEEIPELFDPEREVVLYKDKKTSVALIRELIVNEGSSEQLGLLAQKRAYTDHTYVARMQAIMEIISV